MVNFQKFIKRSTKGIFLGMIVIMVVTLTISFSPGGGSTRKEDQGDAGVIFDDLTISNKDFNSHTTRTIGHLRYRDFVEGYSSIAQLNQLYQQYSEGRRSYTSRDLVDQVKSKNQLNEEERKEKTWEQIILLQDAGDKGIVVSEEEVGKVQEELIAQLPSHGWKDVEDFLGVKSFNWGLFFREALLMEKLLTLVSQSQFPSYAEIYAEILTGMEDGRVLYTSLNPFDTSRFLDLVGRVHPVWLTQIRRKQIKESKIYDYYELNKSLFETPEKIQVKYLLADFEEIQKTIVPTEEEKKTYFDENRDSFVKPPVAGKTTGVRKSFVEAGPEVTKKLKSLKAQERANQTMIVFDKWISKSVPTGVRLEYLLIDEKKIAAMVGDPTKAPAEVEKLAGHVEKFLAEIQKNWKRRRSDFFPSLEASLIREGIRTRFKKDGATSGETYERLREGVIVRGVSEEINFGNNTPWLKLTSVVGEPQPKVENYREDPVFRWATGQGTRVRDVSVRYITDKGIVFFRVKEKSYGEKVFAKFKETHKDLVLTVPKEPTPYFDKENMKEIDEATGTGVSRGKESALATWGFAEARKKGDISWQLETSKGYIVYRLQGKKEKSAPSTIIDSVRERIVKILLKEQMKKRAGQLATEISADINLHGLAWARKKYGVEFKRSKYFQLNGTSSAIDGDATLGKEISRQVSEEKEGERIKRPLLPIGESRTFDGSNIVGKTDWSFVVYMEDRLERILDAKLEKTKFDELRKKKEDELRSQYKKVYVERIVNRANRKDLLDSEGDSQ